MAKYNLVGQRFGRLVVIEDSGEKRRREILWLCQCDCGKLHLTTSYRLKKNLCRSCGCLSKEATTERNYKHGMTNTRLFSVWMNIKDRCYCKTNKAYKYYGARGIKMCPEWKDNFMAFYEWSMANGYNPNAERGKCTIDRINVNGDYEPSNCRWISIKEQERNRRDTHYISYNGTAKSIAEWSEITGINYGTLYSRINDSHWSVEKALETPVRHCRKVGVSA